MDPNVGQVYSLEEAKRLPKEIQDTLVPLPQPQQRPVKRKLRKGKTSDIPKNNVLERRRKASKLAKQARKKNRK